MISQTYAQNWQVNKRNYWDNSPGTQSQWFYHRKIFPTTRHCSQCSGLIRRQAMQNAIYSCYHLWRGGWVGGWVCLGRGWVCPWVGWVCPGGWVCPVGGYPKCYDLSTRLWYWHLVAVTKTCTVCKRMVHILHKCFLVLYLQLSIHSQSFKLLDNINYFPFKSQTIFLHWMSARLLLQ